jgi:predicted peptidase
MEKRVLFTLILYITFSPSFGQDFSLYEKKWLIQNKDTLPYRLLLPQDFSPDKTYPVLFLLHGAGERGNDNEKQLTHGGKLFLIDSVRKQYPAIIVFPQCARNSYWSNVDIKTDSSGHRTFAFKTGGDPTTSMRLLEKLVDQVLHTYPVDKKRVYVGGLSMGGMGTFELVRRHPKRFAAAFPICGGASPATAKKLTRPEWWIFHGAKDDIVPYQLSEQMVNAIKAKKGTVRYTLYPDVNHNSWDNAFAEKELLPWLFAQHK